MSEAELAAAGPAAEEEGKAPIELLLDPAYMSSAGMVQAGDNPSLMPTSGGATAGAGGAPGGDGEGGSPLSLEAVGGAGGQGGLWMDESGLAGPLAVKMEIIEEYFSPEGRTPTPGVGAGSRASGGPGAE